MAKGNRNPVGLYVTMEKYINGKVETLVGIVKEVAQDPGTDSYSAILKIDYFTGQPWPVTPHPSQVKILGICL